MGGSQPNSAEVVASQIERDMPSFEGRTLPPMRELCRRYNVSYYTMLRAAMVLRDKGLIWYTQGKRMQICGRRDEPETTENSAVTAVVQYVEEGIKEGRFRAGHRLPKMQYFTSTCRVSRDKVCEALRALEAKGLLHKYARKWFVGPSRISEPATTLLPRDSGGKPAIVLVIPDYFRFRYYFNHRSIRGFFTTLLTELELFGFDTIIAFRTHSVASVAFASGIQEVRTVIRGLGARYIGCLLCGYSHEFPDIEEWRQSLAGLGKPVGLHVDDCDDTSGLPSRLPSPCFRVYISFGCVVQNAVDVLHQLGHRRIALMEDKVVSDRPWMKKRRSIITRAAESLGDGMTVETAVMPEPAEDKQKPDSDLVSRHGDIMFDHIDRLQTEMGVERAAGEKVIAAIGQHLADEMPSLESFVKTGRHTAVIAANDEVAAECYLWLRYTGRKVPGDISMVSFDNNPDFALFSFSTFDMCLENLGYLVAHQFIRDIPVKKDANGNITTRPRLVDRGSLAPPALRRRR
ncbi:MAG: GntR family transcriptional regulator [Chitinivibrionales bacterium]|nr:GntR family transcriptional regulator [Chitinivibrionales bacterium]MBD3395957.1 GntR family transcriptional regulator [Chitinivibrionales bacterium]